MPGGASLSCARNDVGSDVFNATEKDTNKFPVRKPLPCFEERRVGTPKTVNLDRDVLSSGEAINSSSFASDLHFVGGKLQPFVDLAVGAEADVADRPCFRNAGTQVASSQRDASLTNCCVADCRK